MTYGVEIFENLGEAFEEIPCFTAPLSVFSASESRCVKYLDDVIIVSLWWKRIRQRKSQSSGENV